MGLDKTGKKNPKVSIQIDFVLGDIAEVEAPLLICTHQEGAPLVGNARTFDRLLGGWLTQAIDFQIVTGGLGQIFPVKLKPINLAQQVKAGELGLGEPGQLAPDDVRFAMSNVITRYPLTLTNERTILAQPCSEQLPEGLTLEFSAVSESAMVAVRESVIRNAPMPDIAQQARAADTSCRIAGCSKRDNEVRQEVIHMGRLSTSRESGRPTIGAVRRRPPAPSCNRKT